MQAETIWELRIKDIASIAEALSLAVEELQATGLAEETLIDEQRSDMVLWFDAVEDLEALKLRVQSCLEKYNYQQLDWHLSPVAENWETAWQEHWKGMAIGEKLWVRPSFCAASEDPHRIDIVLDPGMAFGTGQHETTRLCLIAIERLCAQTAYHSMLDMGCGSSLLAIAAAKLGVQACLGIDMAEDAVSASQENACLNHVCLELALADRVPEQQFDLVVANILASPLKAMAEDLAACTKQTLVLSGLLRAQAAELQTLYEQQGLQSDELLYEGDWACIIMHRPKA